MSRLRQVESLGPFAPGVHEALRRAESAGVVRRIWEKDASLWKSEEAHQKIINNALGWLTVARMMSQRVEELKDFADDVRHDGFKHVMLLGMGGSSLAPEVFRRTFGRREDYPELLVLDTTDPDTIASFEKRINPVRTLFIVSSKSGTTIEPLSFYKYFFDILSAVRREYAGQNFVAITDPGTLMEHQAKEANFRRIFLNPADIGGRYSALSYFGMVPAALMGLNVEELLERAMTAMDAAGPNSPGEDNVALRLGCIMGQLAQQGRDKLTLVSDKQLSSLGLWVEQLIAESTGKEGKGIVPVAGEPLGGPEVYGHDRLFVSIGVGEVDEGIDQKLTALEAAGQPVVRRVLDDELDLAAEFFVWEMATAVAGELLGINPFDQPNVQESKDNTNKLLDQFKNSGALPEQPPALTEGELKIYRTQQATENHPSGEASFSSSTSSTISSAIAEHLATVAPGDYIALLAYIQETKAHDELLQAIRTRLRDALHVATTTGYGPRFLHSTGQLHKGGAGTGVFIQLTDDDQTDLPIPGEPYSFSVLKQAQALGDFSSLESHHRRAIRLHLGKDTEAGLDRFLTILRALNLQPARS